MQILGKLDNQNGVLRRQADGGQQPHLEEYVVIQPTAHGRQQRTYHTQGDHQHHRERNRPALVESRQAQEDHQQRQGIERRSLVTGQAFLIGQPGPVHADTCWQLLGQALDFRHGITGTVAGSRLTLDLDGRHPVVTGQFRRPIDPFAGGKGAEGHHLTLVVAYEPLVDIFRVHPRFGLGLQVDALDPAAVDEVVDVARAPGNRLGRVDITERHTQYLGLLIIDDQLVLRLVIQTVGAYRSQYFTLRGHTQQLVAGLHHHLVADPGVILQEQVETSGVTQRHHRRWRKGHDRRIAEAGEVLLGAFDQIEHAHTVLGTLFPGLEADKGNGRILTSTGKAETGYGEYRLDDVRFLGKQLLTHGVHGLLRALHGRARRPDHLGKHHTLILIRQEGAGQFAEQHDHAADDRQIHQQIGDLASEHASHPALILADATLESTVEPAEETALLVALTLGNGFEDGGTQRWGEDQRHQHRQGHGRGNGNRELAIDYPSGATEEGHGHEHRRQHQTDTYQRTLDLGHGFTGGFDWRQTILGHHPFDVLHHHDGIVHQQTDGQHHGEHGQDVDTEAERREHPEGAQQHHRHRQGGNQRGAEVLQEQIHHQEHQHNGFHQRVHHPGDRLGYHRRGLERIDHLHPFREEGPQVLDGLLDCLGGFQRVGPGGQLNGHTRGRLAVIQGAERGVLRTQFNPCDIAQAHLRAIAVDLHQDIAELFRGLEAGLADNGRVQLLTGYRRGTAQLAAGYLHVLRGNGVTHIHRGQLITVEHGRIQPDAHGVGRTEYLEVTHPRGPGNRVLNGRDDEVGEVLVVHAAVSRNQTDHHQEVGRGLGHPDALLLYFLGQHGGSQLQLVLHLDLGDIRIDTLVEGHGDAHAAVGAALGLHVAQAVDAVHLLFDDLGHGVLHGLRRGTRVVDRDVHRRRGDIGVLVDRQAENRQPTHQHHQNRQYPGEDRAVDKIMWHGELSFLSSSIVDLGTALHRRCLDVGRRYRLDLHARLYHVQSFGDQLIADLQAITDQPAVAHRAVGLDDALLDLVLGGDQHGHGLTPGRPADPLLGHQNGITARPRNQLGMHEHARQQNAIRVGEHRTQGHRAGTFVNTDLGELQPPFMLVLGAILKLQQCSGGVVTGLFQPPTGQVATHCQQIPGWLGNIHINGVQLLNGRQRLGLAVAHQCALGDRRATDQPGNRRRHLGVAQIDTRPLQRCIGLQLGCPSLIIGLLTDRTVLDQYRVTLGQSTGGQPGGLGALQCRLVHRCIYLVQLLTRLDLTAFLEQPLLNDAVDLRAHLRHAEGLGTAGQLGGHDKVFGIHRHHPDLRDGLGSLGSFLLGTGAQQGEGGEQWDQGSMGWLA